MARISKRAAAEAARAKEQAEHDAWLAEINAGRTPRTREQLKAIAWKNRTNKQWDDGQHIYGETDLTLEDAEAVCCLIENIIGEVDNLRQWKNGRFIGRQGSDYVSDDDLLKADRATILELLD